MILSSLSPPLPPLSFLSLFFSGDAPGAGERVASFWQQSAAWLCGGLLDGDRIYDLRKARQLPQSYVVGRIWLITDKQT